jgi:hypothetical protein
MKKRINEDHERFLHGHDEGSPFDDEGKMAKSRLHRMRDMAKKISALLEDGDQLPGWVQDHLAVAHENLSQVFSYLEPEGDKWGSEDGYEGDYDDEDDEDEDEEGSSEDYWHDAAEWGSRAFDDDED